jgi:hypothetical protein
LAVRKRVRTAWYRADLHLHTPASADYFEPEAHPIDLLRKAEQRGLDVIAFTDHNTVAGYAGMQREIEQLTYLQQLGRANADELRLLAEYRRLLDKILVLPGFEFTATFGFHVLGIFSPATPLRQLEHLLMMLHIPAAVLDIGSTEVGASSDVLTAYRAIFEAGGIVIAAHVNSAHGVAMQGLDFGGQTRIAYTQDRYLHALEATDLGRRDRRSTQRFFDGTKPEYPRRMRIVQGSDAHALNAVRDKSNRVLTLGIGDRVTEVALAERSFEALLEMFQSNDFARSRPYNPNRQPEDYVQLAREEGETIIQSFHETLDEKSGRLAAIMADVCAFANTNGGTVYVGVATDRRKKVKGIDSPRENVELLRREISQTITPNLRFEIDTQETGGKTVIRIEVPFGEDRPYAIDGNRIYIRDDNETTLAVRDEIVNLVRQGLVFQESNGMSYSPSLSNTQVLSVAEPISAPSSVAASPVAPTAPSSPPSPTQVTPTSTTSAISPPRAGVEILDSETRDGTNYYTMHDLRNGNIVRNVTMSSARRLWHYAIKQREGTPLKPEQIQWHGDIGLWRRYKKGGVIRYDFIQRDGDRLRVYYGVTESGIQGEWQRFLEPETEA